MSRFLPILLGSLMLTALMAGCFGGDEGDGDGDEPEPTNTPTPTNNTTAPPPNQVPQPSFALAIADDNSSYSEPYLVPVETNLTLSFDGSASSDEDGEVVGHAWTVIDPSGKEYTDKTASFDLMLDGTKGSSHYGVWNVDLRVIDDDQGIGQISETFVLHYTNEIEASGFTGPGTAERNDARDEPAGSPLAEGLPITGQYRIHGATVAANASEMTITLTFDEGGPMAIYVFDASVSESDAGTADPEPIAQAESSDSPVELTVSAEDLQTIGRYNIRCELDGTSVGDYTLSTTIMYAASAGNNTTA